MDEEYVTIYSGGEKYENGVGLMMKKEVEKSMIGYWPISDRVMIMKLEGQPFNISVIQVYAPTADHPDTEVEEFYDQVKLAMQYVKSSEMLFVMGDWNAKVGSEAEYPVTGPHGLGERNDRGRRLIEMCKTYNLVVANTLFDHPKRRIYTWKSPGDRYRNQIDYVLCYHRFRNSIKQVKTYPGADIGSDHNPVVMNVMVKLKKTKKVTGRQHLDMNMLKSDEYRNLYRVKVNNMFEMLRNEEGIQSEENEVERDWQIIKKSLTTSAEEVLPRKKKTYKKSWMTEDILEEMCMRKKAKQSNNIKLYEELDRSIRRKCKEAKERWWNEKCDAIEELEAQHKSKEMYDKVKEVIGSSRKGTNCECIRDKDGKMLFDRGEITTRWEEYVNDDIHDIWVHRATLASIS